MVASHFVVLGFINLVFIYTHRNGFKNQNPFQKSSLSQNIFPHIRRLQSFKTDQSNFFCSGQVISPPPPFLTPASRSRRYGSPLKDTH